MGPVVQLVAPGAVVVAACAAAACAALAVAVVVARSWRRRRSTLDAALVRSREQVESLSRRVEELSHEVVQARRAAEQDREYVITSLGHVEAGQLEQLAPVGSRSVERPAVARLVEDQLVQTLTRVPASPVRGRLVDLVVGAVALGHGVRRALSPDVLDRAAAEAHVARRRSRRQRRRQVRHARRREAA